MSGHSREDREFPGGDPRIAVADVSGVRRRVNVELLRGVGLALGDGCCCTSVSR